MIGCHERRASRVAQKNDPLGPMLAQPTDAYADVDDGILEPKISEVAAIARVPTQEPEAAGGEQLTQVVLGTIHVVMRRDEHEARHDLRRFRACRARKEP